MGGFFHGDEIIGAKNLFEFVAAEIGNRKDFFDFETGMTKNSFDVFGMIIIETVGIKLFEVSGLEAERIDIGFMQPIAEHFW